ncbi:MAG: preprotein translocase subunit SecA [Oscillospiraceae bacterium]|jgi:preprotein translocase subunit SecA|nr:preprotein translocase subunit SecA [Oscillospiraceae bacterium]
MGIFKKLFGDFSSKEIKKINPIKTAVLDLEDSYAAMSDSELKQVTEKLKERLQNGESLDDILPDAFAACREASYRVLNMKHYPVQVIGGIVLHNCGISEMKTGEGKTLVATLPAYLNALSGRGVHIVTVNDYLARRDSEWMGKVYRFLGMSVGLIVNGLDHEERRKAYAADITYGTNNEFGFDYLRDNMVQYKDQKVQRGHFYSIVDEVDSILIDEARTPLIISGMGSQSTDLYKVADNFAKSLKMIKVTEVNLKEEYEQSGDGDFIVDEKAKTATLTQSGVDKAEQHFNLDNLMDAENSTIVHHINQAIKARGIMHRDIDYVVKDGEVLIVDEFTGRIMLGRRYNEGLHQAIEAKEGVNVKRESKTLATITFQNYFRLYEKLAGMTGTAMTEDEEFSEIYNLHPVEIPTDKPMIRTDHADSVYKTEHSKFNAVIENIVQCNKKGQPVLVGTISIEKSEYLSKMLKKRGLPHEVLNAKNHEREAEIIAQAGKFGSITIATNMAGRGTDIMLGGNPEFLAKSQLRKRGYSDEIVADAMGFADTDSEEILKARQEFATLQNSFRDEIAKEAGQVKDAGGLFIIGTERHESRRIDNQLRGRSGRQGDPGESRFYLSMEDDLLRLFGGDRMSRLMDTLNVDEDMPIEMSLLTNTIESAQRKVESQNYAVRKHVLEYDNVMNHQREIIYGQRNKVLDNEDLKASILKMFDETVISSVDLFCSNDGGFDDWNLIGLREKFFGWLTNPDDFKTTMSSQEIKDLLTDRGHELYEKREQEFGSEITRDLERMILLKNVDAMWMDHIDAMEELKRGIGLRAYAQKDPVVMFKFESFDMFDEMTASIRENTVLQMFTVRVQKNEDVKREQVVKVTGTSGGSDGVSTPKTVKKSPKVGPNDPCPCGSGKKYKKCCMLENEK